MAERLTGVSQLSGTVRRALGDILKRLSTAVPTGKIAMFGGPVAPDDWLACDGSERPRTDPLFLVIGTTWGVGDGSTTYNLPDLRGRSPFGLDPSDALFDAVGDTGGSADAIVVSHDHPAVTSGAGSAHTHQGSFISRSLSGSGTNVAVHFTTAGSGPAHIADAESAHTHSVDVAPIGSSGTNANLPPFAAVLFIIKA